MLSETRVWGCSGLLRLRRRLLIRSLALTGELGNDNGQANCTWRHLGAECRGGRNVVRGEGVMQAVLHGAAVALSVGATLVRQALALALALARAASVHLHLLLTLKQNGGVDLT